MDKWERDKGMSAPERRVLISTLVAEANSEVLQNDVLRIGCFERTGMLLTLDGSHDDVIKPQGLSKTFLPIRIPAEVETERDPNEPAEIMQPEDQDRLIAPEDEELHDGDQNIQDHDNVVDEECLDDLDPDEE